MPRGRKENLRPFPKGVSGNPKGRAPGTKEGFVGRIRRLFDEAETAEELRHVFEGKLRDGDEKFWRLAVERIWPAKLEVTGEDGGPIVIKWQEPEK